MTVRRMEYIDGELVEIRRAKKRKKSSYTSMARSVPITNPVLSQEFVQGAPLGQTQEIIHLKKPLILS